jgi:hypothetical protein
MNKLKRILGYVWILIGPIIITYLCLTAFKEINNKPTADTIIQWSVFIFISLPVGAGLMLFGWYALKGEYDYLPQNSSELDNNEKKDSH